MASPTAIAEVLPETLPEDFGEWDSGTLTAAAPVKSSVSEAASVSGEIAKPSRQPAEYKASSALVEDRSHDARSPSSPTVCADDVEFLARQNLIGAVADGLPSPALRRPEPSHVTGADSSPLRSAKVGVVEEPRNPLKLKSPVMREANESLFQLFRSDIDVMGEPKTPRRKWMILAVVGAVSILLLLILVIGMFNVGTISNAKQSVQTSLGVTDTQLSTNTPKPSPSTQLTQDKPAATTETQEATDNGPTKEVEAANSSQVPTKMMNDQLTAPARISRDIKSKAVESAPPSANFGTAGTEGLGGSSAMGSVFSGQARPMVKAAPLDPVTISAGVATGLLIQKTTPIYPSIAKAARVSGTVELQATISKTGTVKDLRVVSGPAMLRQAAIDAVRTWRYTPYRLSNEPTEVQTTVHVIFSLGR